MFNHQVIDLVLCTIYVKLQNKSLVEIILTGKQTHPLLLKLEPTCYSQQMAAIRV